MTKEIVQFVPTARSFPLPRFMAGAIALFLAVVPSYPGPADSNIFSNKLGLSGEITGFLDNLEYFNEHRVGETLFGASAKIRFWFRPTRASFFSVGIFGLRRFGDENFFSRALPLFSARYSSDRFSVAIGEILSADGHGLPDLLYKRERVWDPGAEEGIQIAWNDNHCTEEVWVDWDSLNTSNHREHFVAGSSGRAIYGPLMFPLLFTAEHFGGQLYHSSSPVRNNYAGATGVELRLPLRRFFFTGVDIGVLGAGSRSIVREESATKQSGRAVLAWMRMSLRGINCKIEWFKGRDFAAPLGNPVYRSNRPVLAAEIAKHYSTNEYLTITGGIRFEAIDTSFPDYFKNPQYRWWLALRGGFSTAADFKARGRE